MILFFLIPSYSVFVKLVLLFRSIAMQLIPVETRACTPTPVYVCFCMFMRVFAYFFLVYQGFT